MKKQQLKVAAIVVLVTMVVALVLQNTELVPTHILMWSPVLPRFVWLGGTFLAGILAGLLIQRRRSNPAPDPE